MKKAIYGLLFTTLALIIILFAISIFGQDQEYVPGTYDILPDTTEQQEVVSREETVPQGNLFVDEDLINTVQTPEGEITNESPVSTSVFETGIIDCGTSSSFNDCFASAASTCAPAQVTLDQSLDLFGMITNAKIYYEIKGPEDDRCVVYDETLSRSTDLSEEMRQQVVATGVTEEEISVEIAAQNQKSQILVGTSKTCKYPSEDFISIVEQAQQGQYSGSTSDQENYQCTGTFYEVDFTQGV